MNPYAHRASNTAKRVLVELSDATARGDGNRAAVPSARAGTGSARESSLGSSSGSSSPHSRGPLGGGGAGDGEGDGLVNLREAAESLAERMMPGIWRKARLGQEAAALSQR